MKTNPILDELRRFRDAHAKKFNYDVAAICEDLKREREVLKKHGLKFVKPPRRRRLTPRLAA
jgi:Ni,Fe-hydrogenase III component G